jgi:3-phosphoshikimate 1-carboxyvinyltransferase
MTAAVLSSFGFEVSEDSTSLRVEGVAIDPEVPLLIEADASAAAVALAAGCLSGVRVDVPAPLRASAQGDWRIVEHLRAFGCEVDESKEGLVAVGSPINSADLDLSGEPDLAPVLAVVAAAAALRGAGPSALHGLGTLDGKESARGRVLSSGLQAAGFQCEWSGSSLKIYGQPSSSVPVSVDAQEDHRMAFAFSLLGIIRPNLWLDKGSCIDKSWPGFWSSMAE